MKYEIDAKRRTVRVVPEREEDLYFVYLLVERGDVVRGWTVREYKPEGAKEGERVKMYLAVRVESLEYHKFRGSLRIRGPVVEVQEGVEGVKGRRHTFDVVPGREIEIEKAAEFPLDVVEEILKMAQALMPKVLLVSIDDEEAAFAYITALGVELIQVVRNAGKGEESLFDGYLESVRKQVDELSRRLKPDKLVVAGPAMLVEHIARYIRGDKAPQGSGGLAGVYEFIRSGLYDELKTQMGVKAYEKLIHMAATSRESVAIGPQEVEEAASLGRVDFVLVLDSYIKESPEKAWVLLSQIYKTKGRIYIVREDTEVGAGIKAMGGIAAVLRW